MPVRTRQQIVIILAVLMATVSLLLMAYFLFFRTPMVPAYQNIRQADASLIVAELAKVGIPYRLENDGHDVLVPEDRASDARVAVAGSNVGFGGTLGFELFDNSDMGMTEFAQKINFQRAMQGELSRTIMMSQGVEFARVHLALPERSIFRATQGDPTAAVTIEMAKGHVLTPQRIEGIQQLVASSVPGLSQAFVSVLDENGGLVSPGPATVGGFGTVLDERSALAQYYEAKASDAIRAAAPGTQFEVAVNIQPAPQRTSVDAEAADRSESDRRQPDRDGLIIRVSLRTPMALTPDVRTRIDAAVFDRLALDSRRGDALEFATGPIGAPRGVERQHRAVPPVQGQETAKAGGDWPFGTGWRPWVLLFLFLTILTLALRPRRQLDDAQALSFAEQLNSSLHDRDERNVR